VLGGFAGALAPFPLPIAVFTTLTSAFWLVFALFTLKAAS
jgi:hypothetical protein